MEDERKDKDEPMSHTQTQSEWEQQMCSKILALIRNELYLDFRYMDAALCALSFTPEDSLSMTATDGISLFFPPDQILRVYKNNPRFLNRAYLHSVLHCIFRHLWMRGDREPVIWNLACDIACEWVIDSLPKPSVQRIKTLVRLDYYDHLEQDRIPVTAAAIYRDLLTITDPLTQLKLQEEFVTDDHRYWPREKNQSPSSAEAGRNWEKIGRRISQELSLSGQESSTAVSSLETQIRQGKQRRTYREFLSRFTVLREEIQCDYDEFDLGYYTYGLRLYKNMPLIEPRESREVMKILTFVIVIDTSYSTNGDLVRRFLEETFQIIRQRDTFFHKSHIRIIQCDNQVRSDQVVKDESDINRLLASFTLTGGGGTDFRPAFSYVEDLLSSGQLQNLKGLLYFTDGKGIFPKKRPPYDTAFVFMNDDIPPQLPPWAMKIQLDDGFY